MGILKFVLALFVSSIFLTNAAKNNKNFLPKHKSDGYLITKKEINQIRRTKSYDVYLKDSKSKKLKKSKELKDLIIQHDQKQLSDKIKGK
uniref:Uncharacterized protein n=1 Tax=Meloidogyne hapla TaxID=6305 RepID=A0A1I8BIN3_MELHA